MSRLAGAFLGEAFAGNGATSDAPELIDDVEAGPSDLLRSGPSAAALSGAACAGLERGRGGDFRSTCGIGIGGTNLSSRCATGIANGARKLDAGGGTSGAARAWPNVAADASKQRQNLMVGNAVTPTMIAPAQDKVVTRPLAIVTIYGAISRHGDVELWRTICCNAVSIDNETWPMGRTSASPHVWRAELSSKHGTSRMVHRRENRSRS